MVELAGDWEVARWTARIPHPLSLAQARAFIAGLENEHVFAVERLADGEFLGSVSIRGEEIGYYIGRPHWGHGYGTEAVRRLVRLMFEGLGAEKVIAGIMADNPASGRVLEKAGLSFVCDDVGYEGRCGGVSTRNYAITREQWLAAWNARPDAAGRCRRAGRSRRPCADGAASADLFDGRICGSSPAARSTQASFPPPP